MFPDVQEQPSALKKNGPKDQLLHSDSVESPPYSPLEPKSLNLDAQQHLDLTRPGLKVTTPKGYTPTFTTDAPVQESSETQEIDKANENAKTSTDTPFDEVDGPQLDSVKKELDTDPEKEKNAKKFVFEGNAKVKVNTSPTKKKPKAARVRDQPNKKVNETKKLETSSSKVSKDKNTSKKKIDSEPLKEIKIEPNESQLNSFSPEVPIKSEPQLDDIKPKLDFVKESKRADIPRSPPCLTLPPQVILSPPPNHEVATTVISPAITQMKNIEVKIEPGAPITPSRTVIFPPMDISPKGNTQSEHSTKKHFPFNLPVKSSKTYDIPPPLKKGITNEPVSVLVSPVPTEMPVLTFQRQERPKIEEDEIDVMSISHDELKEQLFPSAKNKTVRSAINLDEKRKKKKKKNDKDKDEKKVKVMFFNMPFLLNISFNVVFNICLYINLLLSKIKKAFFSTLIHNN